MSKILLMMFKVLSGFVLLVLVFKCIQWTVEGIKWVTGKVTYGIQVLREKNKLTKEEKKALKRKAREERLNKKLNRQVNEATGA